jgi:phosphoglycolate phosphatase
MTKRKTVIFDLDGTLTDSKPGILGCLTEALDSHGIHWSGPLDWFIGPPADQSLRRLMPDANDPQRLALLRDYRQCYDDRGWAENAVYPGIYDLLDSLKAADWQMFVCTSKRDHFTERILEKFDLRRYFVGVYADTGHAAHSKTNLLRQLLEEQNVAATGTFMVGDRKFDIEAARANGLISIAVAYGYGTPEEFATAQPDYTCLTVEDILPTLSSLGLS